MDKGCAVAGHAVDQKVDAEPDPRGVLAESRINRWSHMWLVLDGKTAGKKQNI